MVKNLRRPIYLRGTSLTVYWSYFKLTQHLLLRVKYYVVAIQPKTSQTRNSHCRVTLLYCVFRGISAVSLWMLDLLITCKCFSLYQKLIIPSLSHQMQSRVVDTYFGRRRESMAGFFCAWVYGNKCSRIVPILVKCDTNLHWVMSLVFNSPLCRSLTWKLPFLKL